MGEILSKSCRLACLLLSVVTVACSDTMGPVDQSALHAPTAAVAASRIMEGSYQMRGAIALGDGRTLSLVQVHFGLGADADGHTYLAQIAVQNVGGSSASTLVQQQYVAIGDSVKFTGTMLTQATATATTLRARVTVSGRFADVTMERIR